MTANRQASALRLDAGPVERLKHSLASKAHTEGKTHNFYHYPARCSHDVARTVIETFSRPGDVILDPFMGGGTTIIEGLALGRRVLGSDVNALAHFVSDVRTTPLSPRDERALRSWASSVSYGAVNVDPTSVDRVRNLPKPVRQFASIGMRFADDLARPRQRAFAKCALLRMGQWALDCRDFAVPSVARLAAQLPVIVESMIEGMEEFVESCRNAGIHKNQITSRKVLFHGSAVDLDQRRNQLAIGNGCRLVFTSPPYPAVHVLYHRWQYRGRRETPAPYWIAGLNDGYGASFYTCGSRTPTGLANYFSTITAAFGSVRALLHKSATIAQLVGFSDAESQLPLYLCAMREAGYREMAVRSDSPMERRVPNRKWYATLKGEVDAAREILLLHRPI